MADKECRACRGLGFVRVGQFNTKRDCGYCEGSGRVPIDYFGRVCVVFVALFVAYMLWQIFLRH